MTDQRPIPPAQDHRDGNSHGDGNRDDVNARAIAWFVRLRSGGAGAEDHAAFASWRDADPDHARADDRLRDAWDAMDGLTDLAREAEHLARATAPPPPPAQLPPARLPPAGLQPVRAVGRRRVLAWSGGALAAGLAGLTVGGPLVRGLRADLATGVGEIATHALADGSTVVLDADSALAVAFTAQAREVVLLRGRAWFAVARDPGRPFVVHAAEGATRALGTAFSVERIGDGVEVTVTEHAVAVTLPPGAGGSADGGGGAVSRRLESGQRLRYGRHGFAPVATVDPRTALAWRNRKLVFDDRPLGEVVEAISRHHSGRIVILDDAVRNHRVSGVVDAGDPGRALAAIVGTLPVRALSLGPYLTVLHES